MYYDLVQTNDYPPAEGKKQNKEEEIIQVLKQYLQPSFPSKTTKAKKISAKTGSKTVKTVLTNPKQNIASTGVCGKEGKSTKSRIFLTFFLN